MSLSRRVVLVAAVGLFVLAAVMVVVFALGTPTTARVSPETAAPVQVADTALLEREAIQEAAPGDPSDPLAIEIPGCVCHSDDPQLVADHATRRMSECFGCHQGGMPEMGR